MVKIKRDTKVYILIIGLVVFIVSLPLLGSGIYGGHDTFFHVQRILSIENALRDGQFPVRIYKEIFVDGGYGYGYGCPLFYPELFLYFPAILCLLGCPVTISYNIFLVLINLITLLAAVYSFSVISKSKSIGLIAAVLYELSVYRLVDLYTRSSMGEVLALAFCPLVLCGLIRVKRAEYEKWWVLALGMSGVLQSHILTFVIMVIVCAVYVLFYIKSFINIKKIVSIIKAALLTVGINLWFLIPFLSVSHMDVKASRGTDGFWDTGAKIVQLFDLTLQGAVGQETHGGAISESLLKTPGIPIIGGCILFVFVIVLFNQGEKTKYIPKQIYGFLITGVVGIYMTTSLFPWNVIRKVKIFEDFFSKFQFIWRFNILTILFLSIVAAYGYYMFFEKIQGQRNLVLVISLFLCVYSLVYMDNLTRNSIKYYENKAVEAAFMDDLYLLADNDIFSVKQPESNADDFGVVECKRADAAINFEFELEENKQKDVYIDVPITYYPGYQAVLKNGETSEKLTVECSPSGVVRIIVPEGATSGDITVEYRESALFIIGDVISGITVLGILVSQILVLRRREQKC